MYKYQIDTHLDKSCIHTEYYSFFFINDQLIKQKIAHSQFYAHLNFVFFTVVHIFNYLML